MFNAQFLQNNSPKLLYLASSDSIIQNNTPHKNNFSYAVYDIDRSGTIQLNRVEITSNDLEGGGGLFSIASNSSAIIQNSTLLFHETLMFHGEYIIYGTIVQFNLII